MRLRVAILGALVDAIESTGAEHTQGILRVEIPVPENIPRNIPAVYVQKV